MSPRAAFSQGRQVPVQVAEPRLESGRKWSKGTAGNLLLLVGRE